jgi:uncharacterized protein
MDQVTSRADVTTMNPARFAKQLVAHLGRKIAFTTDGSASTAQFGAAVGSVLVGDGVITLLATGPDAESVARVEQVLGGHLERFGHRAELLVTWRRTAETTGEGATR